MAKLQPKDPQFGIPVATRMKRELAVQFNNEAARQNKTLSRYVSEYIETAASHKIKIRELEVNCLNGQKANSSKDMRIKELENQLIRERETYKRAIGAFIIEISDGRQKKATQLIEAFNTIMQHEKSK